MYTLKIFLLYLSNTYIVCKFLLDKKILMRHKIYKKLAYTSFDHINNR